jgi:long-chain acyl-CoA synthetase
VALASGTRYEWALADLANMCAGTTTTTIYPTTIADDVAFILADSAASQRSPRTRPRSRSSAASATPSPDVRKVIVFDGEGDGDWVMSLAELEDAGRALLAEEPGAVDARIDSIESDHLATIIYTSGTTGRLRACGCCTRPGPTRAPRRARSRSCRPDDLQYLWLPLAHVFGKQLLTIPLQIGFPTGIDGRIDKIVDNLAKVKPTFMAAAPASSRRPRQRLVDDAEGGRRQAQAVQLGHRRRASRSPTWRSPGRAPGALLAAQHRLADKLVLSTKMRDRFGGRVRFFISGSAALNYEIARWFHSVGLLDRRGLRPDRELRGIRQSVGELQDTGRSAGRCPGLDVRIAEDGEILCAAPGHGGLPQQPRGHGRGARRRRLVPHR